MKMILNISLSSLFLLCCLFSGVGQINVNSPQNYISLSKFKGDTSAYVKYNFVDHQNLYIGEDISYLLQHWELPINSYITGAEMDDTYTNIYLSNDSTRVIDKKYEAGKPVKGIFIR